MPRDFAESLRSIINTWKHVRASGTAQAVRYDRQRDKAKPSSKLLIDRDSEVLVMEQTMDNVAKVLESRDKYVTAVEHLVSLGFEDLPTEVRRTLEDERRKAALSEQGRTPVEVAALYGYARSGSVIRLRERNGQDPQTGYPVPKPLTSREVPEGMSEGWDE